MNCAKCSKPLTDDSKYCAFCGADAALRSSQERPRPTGVQKVLGLLVLVAAAVGFSMAARMNANTNTATPSASASPAPTPSPAEVRIAEAPRQTPRRLDVGAYAGSFLDRFVSSPLCDRYSFKIQGIVYGEESDNVKITQIDRIVATADKYRCILPAYR